jgi:dCMP deaminase
MNLEMFDEVPIVQDDFTRDWLRKREKWDRWFLGMAEYVSTASKDPSTKVGAVIVNHKREVVGTGYNGFPRGVNDDPERYADRPTKYKLVAHAELNACITAGHRAEFGTIYVFPAFGKPPLCSSCCKAVIQSGITRVVGWEPTATSDVIARWADELEAAKLMCSEANVQMTMLVR